MKDYKVTADILRNISYAMQSAKEENLELNWFHIIQRFGKGMNVYPDIDWLNVLSRGQLDSKIWLISELEKLDVELGTFLGTIFLCGGWYASLALMMFNSKLKFRKIRSFDIDPLCFDIAETLNKEFVLENWKFKAVTENIHAINYENHTWQCWSNVNNRMSEYIADTPDTIINTSCEHIENFNKWYDLIPSGKLVVLQSNNYFELEEHIICVKDIKEFKEQCPMQDLLYSGAIKLQKYNRFMLIGMK